MDAQFPEISIGLIVAMWSLILVSVFIALLVLFCLCSILDVVLRKCKQRKHQREIGKIGDRQFVLDFTPDNNHVRKPLSPPSDKQLPKPHAKPPMALRRTNTVDYYRHLIATPTNQHEMKSLPITINSESEFPSPNDIRYYFKAPAVAASELNFESTNATTSPAKIKKAKVLFEDAEFPASDSSLYYMIQPKQQIKWLRPTEIVSNPQFFVDGASRFDAVQGDLGDCWLVAAVAILTMHKESFDRVVMKNQNFGENYNGKFCFRFWRYGEWVDVVVDDRLPTFEGKLIYMHSQSKNEFWSALLEKAYAKLYGSYEALDGGSTAEALEDFTGGLVEEVKVKEIPKEKLLMILVSGLEKESLFGCSFSDENRAEAGLFTAHAYSITGCCTIHHGIYQGTLLLRIRNPWGNNDEWKGAWCDGADEWKYLSSEVRRKMKYIIRGDGEFWMSFDDFCDHFEELEICNMGPESSGCDMVEKTSFGMFIKSTAWTSFSRHGCWDSYEGSAGGCRQYKDTFQNNPQFGIRLSACPRTTGPDFSVIIALLQKYRREEGLDILRIGFLVYKLPDNEMKRQDESFFRRNKPVARSHDNMCFREVTVWIHLPPGNYLIVPSTVLPDEEAEFLLRVYCTGNIKGRKLK